MRLAANERKFRLDPSPAKLGHVHPQGVLGLAKAGSVASKPPSDV
jgi:hypothetical protein